MGDLLWLLIALAMRPLAAIRITSYSLSPLPEFKDQQSARELGALSDVREAVVTAKDGMAYLKVDKSGFDESAAFYLIDSISH